MTVKKQNAVSDKVIIRFGNLSLFASYVMLMRPKKAETADHIWLLAIRLIIFYASLKW